MADLVFNLLNLQKLSNPFPILAFHHSTEAHLNKGTMVQTLATLLMTYKPKPSLKDCLVVSSGLYQKFSSLGDESLEVYDQMYIL